MKSKMFASIWQIKITALAVVFCFTWTTLLWSAPSLTVLTDGGRDVRLPSFADKLNIPESMGTVEERVALSPGPTVIFIQDAHSQYEAQANVKNILEHLFREYGMDMILLEGGSGELDPSLLRFFADKRLNDKAVDKLARDGVVGGPELFLLDHALGEKNGKITAFGVEEAGLYRDNLTHYRNVAENETAADSFLQSYKRTLLAHGSKIFHKELQNFFREWLIYLDAGDGLIRHLKTLKRYARVALGLDLNDARLQTDWPQLVRFFKIKELESSLNPGKAGSDFHKLLAWLEKNGLGEAVDDLRKLNQRDRSEINRLSKARTPREFLESFYESASPKGFSFRQYPDFAKAAGLSVLESELNAGKLFREVEVLTGKILDQLTASEEEKVLVRLFQDALLLEKLFGLEMTREDYAAFTDRKGLLRPSVMSKRISAVLRRPLIGDEATGHMDTIYSDAVLFYESAKAREGALVRQTLSLMKKQKKSQAVLIAGGFHSAGLTRLFRDHGLSYVQVTPQLTGLNEETVYRDAMTLRDDRHTLKSYLRFFTRMQSLGETTLGTIGLDDAHHGAAGLNSGLGRLILEEKLNVDETARSLNGSPAFLGHDLYYRTENHNGRDVEVLYLGPKRVRVGEKNVGLTAEGPRWFHPESLRSEMRVDNPAVLEEKFEPGTPIEGFLRGVISKIDAEENKRFVLRISSHVEKSENNGADDPSRVFTAMGFEKRENFERDLWQYIQQQLRDPELYTIEPFKDRKALLIQWREPLEFEGLSLPTLKLISDQPLSEKLIRGLEDGISGGRPDAITLDIFLQYLQSKKLALDAASAIPDSFQIPYTLVIPNAAAKKEIIDWIQEYFSVKPDKDWDQRLLSEEEWMSAQQLEIEREKKDKELKAAEEKKPLISVPGIKRKKRKISATGKPAEPGVAQPALTGIGKKIFQEEIGALSNNPVLKSIYGRLWREMKQQGSFFLATASMPAELLKTYSALINDLNPNRFIGLGFITFLNNLRSMPATILASLDGMFRMSEHMEKFGVLGDAELPLESELLLPNKPVDASRIPFYQGMMNFSNIFTYQIMLTFYWMFVRAYQAGIINDATIHESKFHLKLDVLLKAQAEGDAGTKRVDPNLFHAITQDVEDSVAAVRPEKYPKLSKMLGRLYQSIAVSWAKTIEKQSHNDFPSRLLRSYLSFAGLVLSEGIHDWYEEGKVEIYDASRRDRILQDFYRLFQAYGWGNAFFTHLQAQHPGGAAEQIIPPGMRSEVRRSAKDDDEKADEGKKWFTNWEDVTAKAKKLLANRKIKMIAMVKQDKFERYLKDGEPDLEAVNLLDAGYFGAKLTNYLQDILNLFYRDNIKEKAKPRRKSTVKNPGKSGILKSKSAEPREFEYRLVQVDIKDPDSEDAEPALVIIYRQRPQARSEMRADSQADPYELGGDALNLKAAGDYDSALQLLQRAKAGAEQILQLESEHDSGDAPNFKWMAAAVNAVRASVHITLLTRLISDREAEKQKRLYQKALPLALAVGIRVLSRPDKNSEKIQIALEELDVKAREREDVLRTAHSIADAVEVIQGEGFMTDEQWEVVERIAPYGFAYEAEGGKIIFRQSPDLKSRVQTLLDKIEFDKPRKFETIIVALKKDASFPKIKQSVMRLITAYLAIERYKRDILENALQGDAADRLHSRATDIKTNATAPSIQELTRMLGWEENVVVAVLNQIDDKLRIAQTPLFSLLNTHERQGIKELESSDYDEIRKITEHLPISFQIQEDLFFGTEDTDDLSQMKAADGMILQDVVHYFRKMRENVKDLWRLFYVFLAKEAPLLTDFFTDLMTHTEFEVETKDDAQKVLAIYNLVISREPVWRLYEKLYYGSPYPEEWLHQVLKDESNAFIDFLYRIRNFYSDLYFRSDAFKRAVARSILNLEPGQPLPESDANIYAEPFIKGIEDLGSEKNTDRIAKAFFTGIAALAVSRASDPEYFAREDRKGEEPSYQGMIWDFIRRTQSFLKEIEQNFKTSHSSMNEEALSRELDSRIHSHLTTSVEDVSRLLRLLEFGPARELREVKDDDTAEIANRLKLFLQPDNPAYHVIMQLATGWLQTFGILSLEQVSVLAWMAAHKKGDKYAKHPLTVAAISRDTGLNEGQVREAIEDPLDIPTDVLARFVSYLEGTAWQASLQDWVRATESKLIQSADVTDMIRLIEDLQDRKFLDVESSLMLRSLFNDAETFYSAIFRKFRNPDHLIRTFQNMVFIFQGQYQKLEVKVQSQLAREQVEEYRRYVPVGLPAVEALQNLASWIHPDFREEDLRAFLIRRGYGFAEDGTLNRSYIPSKKEPVDLQTQRREFDRKIHPVIIRQFENSGAKSLDEFLKELKSYVQSQTSEQEIARLFGKTVKESESDEWRLFEQDLDHYLKSKLQHFQINPVSFGIKRAHRELEEAGEEITMTAIKIKIENIYNKEPLFLGGGVNIESVTPKVVATNIKALNKHLTKLILESGALPVASQRQAEDLFHSKSGKLFQVLNGYFRYMEKNDGLPPHREGFERVLAGLNVPKMTRQKITHELDSLITQINRRLLQSHFAPLRFPAKPVHKKLILIFKGWQYHRRHFPDKPFNFSNLVSALKVIQNSFNLSEEKMLAEFLSNEFLELEERDPLGKLYPDFHKDLDSMLETIDQRLEEIVRQENAEARDYSLEDIKKALSERLTPYLQDREWADHEISPDPDAYVNQAVQAVGAKKIIDSIQNLKAGTDFKVVWAVWQNATVDDYNHPDDNKAHRNVYAQTPRIQSTLEQHQIPMTAGQIDEALVRINDLMEEPFFITENSQYYLGIVGEDFFESRNSFRPEDLQVVVAHRNAAMQKGVVALKDLIHDSAAQEEAESGRITAFLQKAGRTANEEEITRALDRVNDVFGYPRFLTDTTRYLKVEISEEERDIAKNYQSQYMYRVDYQEFLDRIGRRMGPLETELRLKWNLGLQQNDWHILRAAHSLKNGEKTIQFEDLLHALNEDQVLVLTEEALRERIKAINAAFKKAGQTLSIELKEKRDSTSSTDKPLEELLAEHMAVEGPIRLLRITGSDVYAPYKSVMDIKSDQLPDIGDIYDTMRQMPSQHYKEAQKAWHALKSSKIALTVHFMNQKGAEEEKHIRVSKILYDRIYAHPSFTAVRSEVRADEDFVEFFGEDQTLGLKTAWEDVVKAARELLQKKEIKQLGMLAWDQFQSALEKGWEDAGIINLLDAPGFGTSHLGYLEDNLKMLYQHYVAAPVRQRRNAPDSGSAGFKKDFQYYLFKLPIASEEDENEMPTLLIVYKEKSAPEKETTRSELRAVQEGRKFGEAGLEKIKSGDLDGAMAEFQKAKKEFEGALAENPKNMAAKLNLQNLERKMADVARDILQRQAEAEKKNVREAREKSLIFALAAGTDHVGREEVQQIALLELGVSPERADEFKRLSKEIIQLKDKLKASTGFIGEEVNDIAQYEEFGLNIEYAEDLIVFRLDEALETKVRQLSQKIAPVMTQELVKKAIVLGLKISHERLNGDKESDAKLGQILDALKISGGDRINVLSDASRVARVIGEYFVQENDLRFAMNLRDVGFTLTHDNGHLTPTLSEDLQRQIDEYSEIIDRIERGTAEAKSAEKPEVAEDDKSASPSKDAVAEVYANWDQAVQPVLRDVAEKLAALHRHENKGEVAGDLEQYYLSLIHRYRNVYRTQPQAAVDAVSFGSSEEWSLLEDGLRSMGYWPYELVKDIIAILLAQNSTSRLPVGEFGRMVDIYRKAYNEGNRQVRNQDFSHFARSLFGIQKGYDTRLSNTFKPAYEAVFEFIVREGGRRKPFQLFHLVNDNLQGQKPFERIAFPWDRKDVSPEPIALTPATSKDVSSDDGDAPADDGEESEPSESLTFRPLGSPGTLAEAMAGWKKSARTTAEDYQRVIDAVRSVYYRDGNYFQPGKEVNWSQAAVLRGQSPKSGGSTKIMLNEALSAQDKTVEYLVRDIQTSLAQRMLEVYNQGDRPLGELDRERDFQLMIDIYVDLQSEGKFSKSAWGLQSGVPNRVWATITRRWDIFITSLEGAGHKLGELVYGLEPDKIKEASKDQVQIHVEDIRLLSPPDSSANIELLRRTGEAPPIKYETPSKNETPLKDEVPIRDETPVINDTPVKDEAIFEDNIHQDRVNEIEKKHNLSAKFAEEVISIHQKIVKWADELNQKIPGSRMRLNSERLMVEIESADRIAKAVKQAAFMFTYQRHTEMPDSRFKEDINDPFQLSQRWGRANDEQKREALKVVNDLIEVRYTEFKKEHPDFGRIIAMNNISIPKALRLRQIIKNVHVPNNSFDDASNKALAVTWSINKMKDVLKAIIYTERTPEDMSITYLEDHRMVRIERRIRKENRFDFDPEVMFRSTAAAKVGRSELRLFVSEPALEVAQNARWVFAEETVSRLNTVITSIIPPVYAQHADDMNSVDTREAFELIEQVRAHSKALAPFVHIRNTEDAVALQQIFETARILIEADRRKAHRVVLIADNAEAADALQDRLTDFLKVQYPDNVRLRNALQSRLPIFTVSNRLVSHLIPKGADTVWVDWTGIHADAVPIPERARGLQVHADRLLNGDAISFNEANQGYAASLLQAVKLLLLGPYESNLQQSPQGPYVQKSAQGFMNFAHIFNALRKIAVAA